MIEKTEAINGLLKAVSATMGAAGLSAEDNGKIMEVGDLQSVTYSGDAGTVRLEFEGIAMRVLASKPDDKEFHELSTTLFETGAEDFDAKELRSIANDVIESAAKFFGVTPVYDDAKAPAKGKGKQQPAKKAQQPEKKPAPSAGRKKKHNPNEEYDAMDLANRLEAIYPETRGKIDENMDKYGRFLPEEYFQEVMADRVMKTIRSKDRQTLKRLFKAFNLFYDEGEKDTQSLVAVSLLGFQISQAEDSAELLEYVDTWCNDTLRPAVDKVVWYFQSGNKRKKVRQYLNPKPYKPSAKERAQKNALQSLNGSK